MRWSTVSHRHTGQGEHGREASPATRRERRVLLPGCGGAGCSLPVFALKSFSIDSRRAFICAATLARDLKSCSAVSQRQCEQARRSRTRHSGRYISFHGVKREPASRNITRKTQCKTARSSRRPAFHAWARVCVTSNIVAEKLFLFWPSAFPATSLHFAGREQEPPSPLSQETIRCMRCDTAGRLPRACSGPGQYGRQQRRSSKGRDCSLPSLAFRSQVCSPPPCP